MRSRFPKYAKLLRLYPKAYRDKYAGQIQQTLADMLDDQPTAGGKALVWARATWDLPLNLINQYTIAIGDNLMRETPGYIKRNGIAAAALLAPFVAALAANTLDQAVNHHTLYHSWLWSTPALIIWVTVLPALAFIIALVSYILYAATGKGARGLRRLLDIRHTWPILLTGLFGLGVIFLLLFHDSAHCWAQNPVHDVTKLQQTWQCSSRGFLGGK